GIGEGFRGLTMRYPAVLVFSFASMQTGVTAPLPENGMIMAAMIAGEFMFGIILGMIPSLIISGVQMAGQLASTPMGFGAGQLFDPTIGGAQSDLGRLFGDLTIVLFLLIGGHHIALMAAAGLGGKIIPGSFFIGEVTVQLLIERTADIFRMGVMLSAPVIVA